MGALTGLDDVINRTTGGNSGTPQTIWFQKVPLSGSSSTVLVTTAARMTSLWQYEGQPSDGVAPTTVANPTSGSIGSLGQNDATGGRQKYLLGVSATSTAVGTLILYDRLQHIGGFSGTTITAQSVGGSLTRNTGGQGNQIWIEIYLAIGTTATTITANYTNEFGTASRISQPTAIGAAGFDEAQRIIVMPLAQGDAGVQAVSSVTVLASTLTAGNFGVTVAQPLLYLPISVASVGGIRDLVMNAPGIIPISAGACLAWAWFSNGAVAPYIHGMAQFIEA